MHIDTSFMETFATPFKIVVPAPSEVSPTVGACQRPPKFSLRPQFEGVFFRRKSLPALAGTLGLAF